MYTFTECSAYDTDEWIMRLKRFLVDTALNHPRVRMVGICFGHQVICEALGGKVTKNPKGTIIAMHRTG